MTQCRFPDCGKVVRAAGWCEGHYRQHRLGKTMSPLRPRTRNGVPSERQCTFAGCGRPLSSALLCDAHYRQQKRGADLTPIQARDGSYWVNGKGYLARHQSWTNPDTGRRVQQAVLQHREVMEEVLGRPLRSNETVHHKNTIRHDNRPENLELWASSQPSGGRVQDLVSWAKEIIETYGAEAEMLEKNNG